jgi:hypothetical protein
VVVFTTVVLLVLEWAGRDRKMPLKKKELRSMVVGGK